MSWRDNMRPAKFRGVPFFVETAELKGGRRGPVHEFPKKNIPWREDMGRKARGFSLEGYVVGEEYLTAKQALIAALESDDGPGELIHPYYGTLRLAAGDFTVHESRTEGGLARISMEFFETTPVAPQPATVANPASTVAASATVAKAAVGADFASKYNPGTLLASVEGALLSATQTIKGLIPALPLSAQDIAGLSARVTAFGDSVSSLVNTPTELFDGLVDLFDDLFDDLVGVPTSALISIYSFDPGATPPSTTANRVQELANFSAVQVLVQRLALIQAAVIAPTQAFVSYEEAVTLRSQIVDLIDEQAESAPDDTFPALMQLRADLSNAVPGEGGDLPRLVSHIPAISVPSLVLAHRLYGNLDLEADLLARNHVAHPGFVRGGNELEVLSDE